MAEPGYWPAGGACTLAIATVAGGKCQTNVERTMRYYVWRISRGNESQGRREPDIWGAAVGWRKGENRSQMKGNEKKSATRGDNRKMWRVELGDSGQLPVVWSPGVGRWGIDS